MPTAVFPKKQNKEGYLPKKIAHFHFLWYNEADNKRRTDKNQQYVYILLYTKEETHGKKYHKARVRLEVQTVP